MTEATTVDGVRLKPRQCGVCGREFGAIDKEPFCGPCEAEVRAREPAQLLKDLRLVYAGEKAITPGQNALLFTLKNNQGDFLNMLKQAEKDYAIHMRELLSSLPEKTPETPEERDKGEVRVEEVLDRLLDSWGK